MQIEESRQNRKHRAPRPLDGPRLEELALAYVARFATSAAKLEAYLLRKLRERGWAGENAPDPARVAARYVELGYVDDEAYARARAGGLLRRGYGPRRVAQALRAAGIGDDIRGTVAGGPDEARQAALALARRRRFGPFAADPPERATREKQIAAMLRAGHSLDHARRVVNAAGIGMLEEWALGDGDEAS